MPKFSEQALSFRAMNTDVEAIICASEDQRDAAKDALQEIQETFSSIEKTLSRFKPDSELSLLNASAGRTFKASPVMFEVVRLALQASEDTNGIFDPTILPSLIASGYDKSFEELKPRQGNPTAISKRNGSSWRNIFVDPASSTIFLPPGISLDLGGIGKGWTVDRVCQKLKPFPGYAVDAGGDIRAGGRQTDGSPWTVAVDDPFLQGHDLMVLRLCGGAVCTSTITRRRWKLYGNWQHHLINPRSGQPSNSGVASATVIAASAARAEIAAKSALILGPKAGLEFIDSQLDIRGLLILENGRMLISSRFQELQNVA